MGLLKLLCFLIRKTLCPEKIFLKEWVCFLNVLELETRLGKPQKPWWLCTISHLYKVVLTPKEVPDDS